MLMDSVIGISENVRTISAAKLQRKISLIRMHNSLIDLFCDRTAIDTSLSRFNDEDVFETLRYNHCQALNDERTIKFNQGWKQPNDVFDEKRQIWIGETIDPIKDDLFIPRDDAND